MASHETSTIEEPPLDLTAEEPTNNDPEDWETNVAEKIQLQAVFSLAAEDSEQDDDVTSYILMSPDSSVKDGDERSELRPEDCEIMFEDEEPSIQDLGIQMDDEYGSFQDLSIHVDDEYGSFRFSSSELDIKYEEEEDKEELKVKDNGEEGEEYKIQPVELIDSKPTYFSCSCHFWKTGETINERFFKDPKEFSNVLLECCESCRDRAMNLLLHESNSSNGSDSSELFFNGFSRMCIKKSAQNLRRWKRWKRTYLSKLHEESEPTFRGFTDEDFEKSRYKLFKWRKLSTAKNNKTRCCWKHTWSLSKARCGRKSSYVCPQCSQMFDSKKSLIQHQMQQHHSKKRRLPRPVEWISSQDILLS